MSRTRRHKRWGLPGVDAPLLTVHEILTAWSLSKITAEQAIKLLELDAGDDLHEIAKSNGIVPPP